MKIRKLKCFVAMAFEKSDTDQLYLKIIKKALKHCDSLPRRVDTIEHNSEINRKIVEEIIAADFVIADLTYARPSVYYEAGFAERILPVIYIARADHFKTKLNDEFGNQTIHFDLQMKNIIKWRNYTDEIFLKKLTNRIKYVTKPIRKRIEADNRLLIDHEKFMSISRFERRNQCEQVLAQVLKKDGFINKSYTRRSYAPPWANIYTKLNGSTVIQLIVVLVEKFVLTDFRKLAQSYSYYDSITDLQGVFGKNKVKSIVDATIAISIDRINLKTLHHELYNYRQAQFNNTQFFYMVYNPDSKRQLSTKDYFFPIDKIYSLADLRVKLLQYLKVIPTLHKELPDQYNAKYSGLGESLQGR